MLCDYCKYFQFKTYDHKCLTVHCSKNCSVIFYKEYESLFNCNKFKLLSKKKQLIKEAIIEIINKDEME